MPKSKSTTPEFVRTLKVRIKDRHAPVLRRMAAEVNTVWNAINAHQIEVYRREGKLLSGFDLHPFTVGSSFEFDLIGSVTIDEVRDIYASKRRIAKRSRLRWRKTHGRKRSLGWIPFKSRGAKWRPGSVRFAGRDFSVWDSYGLSNFIFRSGCFAEDACGHWYFCVQVLVGPTPHSGGDPVGIDLGLKEIAVCSDGHRLENPRWYRRTQDRLAVAQRARHRKQAARLHRKIKRQRQDCLHKFSRQIVDSASAIYIGDISPTTISKTKLAKSSRDASWGILKAMLRYKGQQAGIEVREVPERYTSQVCSACGALPSGSPKGRADLGIREWACSSCGVIHDRDLNAALNILAVGHGRPAEGISARSRCQLRLPSV